MHQMLQSWWRQRSLREQRLLLAGATVMTLVLAWLLVMRPLEDALSDAKARHGDAVVALAEVRAQAEAIREAAKSPSPPAINSLDSMIGNAAAEAGFPVTRIDRQGAREVTLVLESVRPQAFFAWVHQMESVRGLAITRFSATPNTDQTLAVQVTFAARGA